MMGLASLTRGVGWLAVLAIAILSLVPGEIRPATGAPAQLEHAVAYAGTAFLLLTGYQRPLLTIIPLLGYGACLEAAQILVPGRYPLINHYLASAAGVLIGTCAAWTFSTLLGGGANTSAKTLRNRAFWE
jgi:hypothetical protein